MHKYMFNDGTLNFSGDYISTDDLIFMFFIDFHVIMTEIPFKNDLK